jgi:hypothetical protein
MHVPIINLPKTIKVKVNRLPMRCSPIIKKINNLFSRGEFGGTVWIS